jgi:membrane protein
MNIRPRSFLPRNLKWKVFFKDLKKEVLEDRLLSGAAALAFYLTLAIFPALLFILSLVPFLPVPNIDQAIMDMVRQALPGDTAELVKRVVSEVTSQPSKGLISVGFLGTIWAASSGMKAVIDELNVTYDVEEGRRFLKVRSIAIGLTVGMGLLVIGAFLLIVLGEVIHP